MSDTAHSPASASRQTRPHAWWILAIVLGAAAMDILDGTIVNVAIPSIREDLGTSSAGLQWIVGGYALTFAIGLIAGGRLGDIYGRKRMFMIGIISFTAMSLACGLAPSTGVLIVTRLLQGFAAALMVPQNFGIIRETFSQEDLPKALSFWGPSSALGALLGPVIGGLLIELDAFGTAWRGVFLVNLPIGLLIVAGAHHLLPADATKDQRTPGLDVVGAVILGIAVGLLFFPLIEGRELDWPLWTFALFPAGLALVAVFAWYERGRERAGRSQLILTSIFRRSSYVSGAVLVALLFCMTAGLLLVTTLYLQIDQGFSAVHAGLTLIPLSVGTAIGAIAAGMFLLKRVGRHTLHIGALVAMIGAVLLVLVLDASGESISTFDLALPTLVLGAGMGLLIGPSYSFALSGVAHRELGSASGVVTSMQQLGTAVGVAVIGTIFFSVADDRGMLIALERSVVVVAGLILVIGALIFLLPMHRDQEEV